MSFLNTIVDIGKSAWNFISGDSFGSNVVKTIMTGYALNKISTSMTKGNDSARTSAATATPQRELGQRLSIAPASENRVPVIYGTAIAPGVITDAKMSADNQIMHFVLTIAEVTGVKMSDGEDSTMSFEDVYWNNNRIIFQSDGITASYMVDNDGNIDRSIAGLVKVYCYADGSITPVVPDNYTNGSLAPAYNVMPGWTNAHTMNKLVFAIVRVEYSREKNITGIGGVSFAVTNTMNLPGDCIFDYMTSTRYGAGIDPLEIKSA